MPQGMGAQKNTAAGPGPGKRMQECPPRGWPGSDMRRRAEPSMRAPSGDQATVCFKHTPPDGLAEEESRPRLRFLPISLVFSAQAKACSWAASADSRGSWCLTAGAWLPCDSFVTASQLHQPTSGPTGTFLQVTHPFLGSLSLSSIWHPVVLFGLFRS